MGLIPKIAGFYASLWVALWLLRRHPDSLLSRIAFSWNGPIPSVGELRSQFQLRQSLFALGWLVQILFVAAVLVLVGQVYEPIKSSQAFQVVSMFALTIGAGMAFLSSIYCYLASLKARHIGPDPVFELLLPQEHDSEIEEPNA